MRKLANGYRKLSKKIGKKDCSDAEPLFDTSALVKRYYNEPGTEVVDRLIETDEVRTVVTAITVIEAVSAFRRKYNREDIPEEVVDKLLTKFFDEALSDFLIVSTEEALFTHSFDLILEDNLRTLDSLQLSAALAVSEEVENLAFISADKELVSVANSKGLETLNPDTDDAEVLIDIEAILETYLDDASQLFRISPEDSEIHLREAFENAAWRERVLIHLIGQRYAQELKNVNIASLGLDYFDNRIAIDGGRLQTYLNELDEDHLVERDEETGGWRIVPENLPESLSRIDGVDVEEL